MKVNSKNGKSQLIKNLGILQSVNDFNYLPL
jgi:hypothetical protein